MSLGSAVTQQLLSLDAVTAVIAHRLYPVYDPQVNKVYPQAVYKIESVSTLNCNDGPTGNQSCDYVISVIGETYADADNVAAVILTALDGSSGTWSGTKIQGVFLKPDGVSDDIVTEPQTEEILFYLKEMSFSVMA